MTVSANIAKKSFSGDGSTTDFDLGSGFIFFAETELVVTLRVDSTGVETLQTLTTDYTVSGGDGATGTVRMVTAPASGETLLVQRVLPLTQGDDFVNNSASDAEVVEDRFDKLTLMVQQLDEADDRTLKASAFETSIDELPSPASRRGKVLAFIDDSNAQPQAVDAADADLVTLNDALSAINALTPAEDRLPYYTGASAAALTTLTAGARAVLALTGAADKGIHFTGSGAASTHDLTAAARTVLDDTSVAAMRTTLGANGNLKSVQVFTSSGTWNRPSGCVAVLMEIIGAGGGGADTNTGSSQASPSGGGGQGGYARKFLDVSGISSSTITVGAGGDNADGGDSSWADGTNTITGSGGKVSEKHTSGADIPAEGGAGGAATGGDVNESGASGGFGISVNSTSRAVGGTGGGLGGGLGGWQSGTGGAVGTNGASPGGGGGGGASIESSSAAGGEGADGRIIIWEFY